MSMIEKLKILLELFLVNCFDFANRNRIDWKGLSFADWISNWKSQEDNIQHKVVERGSILWDTNSPVSVICIYLEFVKRQKNKSHDSFYLTLGTKLESYFWNKLG